LTMPFATGLAARRNPGKMNGAMNPTTRLGPNSLSVPFAQPRDLPGSGGDA
jgi:hypothetical protein